MSKYYRSGKRIEISFDLFDMALPLTVFWETEIGEPRVLAIQIFCVEFWFNLQGTVQQ